MTVTLNPLKSLYVRALLWFYEAVLRELGCCNCREDAQTVSIKNRSDTAIVISNAKSEANGTDNIWVCSRTNEANYVTIAPGETGTFTFNVLAKGYNSPDAVKSALKKLNPSIVFAENKSAANQSFVKFDMANADKFAIDIKF